MKLIYKAGLVILIPLILLVTLLQYVNTELSNQAFMEVARQENIELSHTVLGPLNSFTQRSAFLSAVLMFVTVILIIYLLSRIIKPIKSLTKSTQAIAEGDLSRRVSVTSKDEIGQLANSFNTMADKLQRLYTGLEENVNQKTAQLAQKIQELEQQKAKDEAILLSIGQGVIAFDINHRIILINDTTKNILGIGDDVLHRNFSEAIVSKDGSGTVIPEEVNPIYESISTGKRVQITATSKNTYNFVKTDGSMCPVSLTCTPIIVKGEINGAIIVFRDITHDKEIDKMKTEFISLASHQLRTPLSAIKWFTEMLLAGDAGLLNTEQTDFAKNISESTERMIELVNGLLNISRIESGRIIVDPKPTDLVELVNNLVQELKVKIDAKQQHLIVSTHDQLPLVSVDPKLIRQVYLNLLTNAIKYTAKEGEINVFISKKDDYIISQVSDNGFGIPQDQQQKIFQKFFRAENAVKIETDGTGLGLYLAKAIVDSSGGKIWFKSEVGKGTTVWFSLLASGTPAKKGEVSLD